VTVVGAAERDLRHGVVQHPGADRMPFGVVRVQEALGCSTILARSDHDVVGDPREDLLVTGFDLIRLKLGFDELEDGASRTDRLIDVRRQRPLTGTSGTRAPVLSAARSEPRSVCPGALTACARSDGSFRSPAHELWHLQSPRALRASYRASRRNGESRIGPCVHRRGWLD
jgi:hypothetical protein